MEIFFAASSALYRSNDGERKSTGSLGAMAINHRHSLARREYIKRHDSFTRALSRREIQYEIRCPRVRTTHVQALALIGGGLRGTPRARARSRQGRRDEGRKEVYGNREEERRGEREKERREAMSTAGVEGTKE